MESSVYFSILVCVKPLDTNKNELFVFSLSTSWALRDHHTV